MMEKSLVRSSRCADCGAEMLWKQNAWKTGDTGQAAYCCEHGHVVDPFLTPQCPGCGIHDTVLVSAEGGRQQFRCTRCEEGFEVPR